jgi:hypothetical protein
MGLSLPLPPHALSARPVTAMSKVDAVENTFDNPLSRKLLS